MAEQLIRNQQVAGSNPIAGSMKILVNQMTYKGFWCVDQNPFAFHVRIRVRLLPGLLVNPHSRLLRAVQFMEIG